jgi:hypothetical protein
MNKYSYATNNPLIFKDPLGTSNCLIHYVETQAAFAKAGVPQGGAAAGIAVCAEDIGTRGLQWVTPVGMPWLAENKAAAMRTTRRVISSTIRMILLQQYVRFRTLTQAGISISRGQAVFHRSNILREIAFFCRTLQMRQLNM